MNLFDISGMIRKFIQRSCPTINKMFFNEFVLGLGNCMSNLLPLRLQLCTSEVLSFKLAKLPFSSSVDGYSLTAPNQKLKETVEG